MKYWITVIQFWKSTKTRYSFKLLLVNRLQVAKDSCYFSTQNVESRPVVPQSGSTRQPNHREHSIRECFAHHFSWIVLKPFRFCRIGFQQLSMWISNRYWAIAIHPADLNVDSFNLFSFYFYLFVCQLAWFLVTSKNRGVQINWQYVHPFKLIHAKIADFEDILVHAVDKLLSA